MTKFLDASLRGRDEEAYRYISSKDKKVKSLQQYIAEQSDESNALARALAQAQADKVSYQIKQVRIEGERAKATVAVTGPDFSSLFKDALGVAFLTALADEEAKKKAGEMLVEKYKEKEVPLTTSTQSFDLINEPEGWKVFLGWEVQSLLADAKRLREEKKLYEALEKYKGALELKGESVEAREGEEETQEEIEIFEEKQAYLPKIEIKDFRVGKGSRFTFGDPEPAIFGKIVNKGDRILKEVQITVYFLGKDGNPIAEKDYHPVLVTEFSFGRDNKPLKPGYIKEFGYVVGDDAPSDWSGKARAQVTGIEFQK